MSSTLRQSRGTLRQSRSTLRQSRSTLRQSRGTLRQSRGRRAAAQGSTVARVVSAAIIAATVTAAACSPAQNGGADSPNPPAAVVSADSRISMQRLPCFGTCPVYRVDITADGTVTFTGERYVETTGTASATIAPAAAAALVQGLVDGGFHDFADRYTQDEKACGSYHTDAPRVILTLRTDGRTKTVEHDYGCSGAPAALRVLEERVDSVAGVERWVGARD